MTTRILQGDVRDVLPTLAADSTTKDMPSTKVGKTNTSHSRYR